MRAIIVKRADKVRKGDRILVEDIAHGGVGPGFDISGRLVIRVVDRGRRRSLIIEAGVPKRAYEFARNEQVVCFGSNGAPA